MARVNRKKFHFSLLAFFLIKYATFLSFENLSIIKSFYYVPHSNKVRRGNDIHTIQYNLREKKIMCEDKRIFYNVRKCITYPGFSFVKSVYSDEVFRRITNLNNGF